MATTDSRRRDAADGRVRLRGTVTRWLKQEGEQVEADEPLLEISTDKVDTEVPSPGSGTLTQILVQEGETVDVGTKLAVIGGEGGGTPASTDDVPEPATAQAAAESAAVSDAPATPTAETVEEATPAAPAASETTEPSSTNGKTFVSPVVARSRPSTASIRARCRGPGAAAA